MESSMFTRMMTASPGLCDLAKEWSVLHKISKWLGLGVCAVSCPCPLPRNMWAGEKWQPGLILMSFV